MKLASITTLVISALVGVHSSNEHTSYEHRPTRLRGGSILEYDSQGSTKSDLIESRLVMESFLSGEMMEVVERGHSTIDVTMVIAIGCMTINMHVKVKDSIAVCLVLIKEVQHHTFLPVMKRHN